MRTTKQAGGQKSASQSADDKSTQAMSAYFLGLTVRNIRCFGPDPQTLDLSDRGGRPAPWTILLGNNGTGKTTLLQLLAGFDSDRVKIKASDGAQTDLLTYRFAMGGFWPEVLSTFVRSGRRTEGDSSATVRVATTGAGLTAAGAYDASECTVSFWGPYGPHHFSPATYVPLKCFGYGASRRMGSASRSREEDPLGSIRSLFFDDANLRNAEEWLTQLDYSASKKSEIAEDQRRRLDQVIEVLVKLLPDVDDIGFTKPTKARPTPRVWFRTPYGTVPVAGIAYGYQTLVAWIVDFASRMFERYPDSKNPLAEPAVVLVDELDLHLHPSWQREIMGYLSERFPNTQFVVTAHSPLVVQAAAGIDANVAVLRCNGDHVIIDNDVDSVRGWRVDQILTSDLYGTSPRSPDIQRLLDKRRVILAKPKLSGRDRARLEELEEQIGWLPAGESAQDVRTAQLLQETLGLWQQSRSSSK